MHIFEGPQESVHGCSTSQVLDAEESLRVMSITKGTERKICTLQQSMCMVVCAWKRLVRRVIVLDRKAI